MGRNHTQQQGNRKALWLPDLITPPPTAELRAFPLREGQKATGGIQQPLGQSRPQAATSKAPSLAHRAITPSPCSLHTQGGMGISNETLWVGLVWPLLQSWTERYEKPLKGRLYKIPEEKPQKATGIRAQELPSWRQDQSLQIQARPHRRRSLAALC